MRRSWIGSPGWTPPTLSPWPASSAPWSSTDLSRRGRDLFLALFLHSIPLGEVTVYWLATTTPEWRARQTASCLFLACVPFPCGTHFNLVKVLVCITTEQSHSVVVFCLTAANILSPLNISFDKMLNFQIFISSEYKNTTIICKKNTVYLKTLKYCITFKLSKIS